MELVVSKSGMAAKNSTTVDSLRCYSVVLGTAAAAAAAEYKGMNAKICIKYNQHGCSSVSSKGQIKTVSRLGRRRFFRKTNKQICFVLLLFHSSRQKQQQFVHSFFENLRRPNLLTVLSDLYNWL